MRLAIMQVDRREGLKPGFPEAVPPPTQWRQMRSQVVFQARSLRMLFHVGRALR